MNAKNGCDKTHKVFYDGVDEPSDLFNLLTAIRVVNTEMTQLALSPNQRLGARCVVNQLVDLALEIAMDDQEITPISELPF